MRFFFFLIFLFNFQSSNIIASINYMPESADSVFASVISLEGDSLKVMKLIDLSNQFINVQLDTAYTLTLMALDLSEELNVEYCRAKSLYQLGVVLRYKGSYTNALKYTEEAFELFEQLNEIPDKAETLNLQGNLYKRIGDYENSVQCLFNSLNIYISLNDSLNISRSLNNLGLLYTDMKEYDKSLDYHIKSLEIYQKLGNRNFVITSLLNIGDVNRQLGKNLIALEYFNKAIKLIDDKTSKYSKALLLHNIAIVYQQLEKYDQASEYYRKAVEIEEEIGEKDLYLSSMQGLGTMMIMHGENKKGLSYILKAYNLAKKQGDLYKRKSICSSLIWAYKWSKDYEKSIFYFDDLLMVNDSLLGLEKMKLVTQIEQKYEAEKRERQIAYLEKEKEIQELEFIKQKNEAKQKRFQLNSLIVIVALALVVLVLLARDNKKRKTRNQLLIKQNKKIINQRTEIVRRNQELLDSNQTKDKLLQIIAHDLRSPLVSIDSLTQLIPHWVEEQDYDSLKKLSKSMEVSITNVLSLIDNLLNWALSQQGSFPYNPENFEVVSTLKDAINIYYPIAELKHIDLKFKKSRESSVSADKNMFLTIIRNLLNNAIKFTPENGSVEVGVDYNDQFAKVWVEDSGVGIPDDKKEEIFKLANGSTRGTKGEVGKGLGLFFCKEFISINKGDVYIESASEKGTKITFTLPLVNMERN